MLRFVKTAIAVLVAAFAFIGVAHASAVTLGIFVFSSEQFGATLVQLDGGDFTARSWLNASDADPGSPDYFTGASVSTASGATMGFGPSLAAATGATRAEYYGDPTLRSSGFAASPFVPTVDRAVVGIANGAPIESAGFAGASGLESVRVVSLDAAAVAEVPEPASLALLGIGMLAAACLRLRRR